MKPQILQMTKIIYHEAREVIIIFFLRGFKIP